MKKLSILILGLAISFLITACNKKESEPQPALPPLAEQEFIISGRLLKSCSDLTPIANKLVILYPNLGHYQRYTPDYYSAYTDSLGYFSIKGTRDYPSIELWYGNFFGSPSTTDPPKELYTNLVSENADLGNIYLNRKAKAPSFINCLVRYNLRNSNFKDGDTVKIDYQTITRFNSQRIYTSKSDFSKTDTILIEEDLLDGLIHPQYSNQGATNLSIKLRIKGFGNELQFAITSNCTMPEIIVPIP